MSVLHKYYDKASASVASPILDDYDRIVEYDSDGNEIVSFVKVDYPSLVKSHGSLSDWSLTNLLKAGVDPNFPVHTGMNTRLEGFNAMSSAVDSIVSVLDSDSKPVNVE